MILTTDTLLQEPVLRTLAYYDLFDYPLTTSEVYTFLPVGNIQEEELSVALQAMAMEGIIKKAKGFWFLPHRSESSVERRIEMELRGKKMWKMARRMSMLMRHVPCVRGIFISGQLCRYIADRNSDIDYFVVTEPNRLWIVRCILVLFRRVVLLNNRKYFCVNYYVTSDNLKIQERNPYVACEVASVKPMFNRELFEEFMQENTWVSDYFPNFSMSRIKVQDGVEKASSIQKKLELCLPNKAALWLDIRLMKFTRAFWQRKFPSHSQRAHEISLRTRRNESRAHPNDVSAIILQKYYEGLRRYGVLKG